MSADIIKVSVLYRKTRNKYFLQYRDPASGSKVTRATDTRQRREADRQAAVWQKELNTKGQKRKFGRLDWGEFRELYEDEHVSSLAARTDDKIAGVLNVFEQAIKPCRLSDVNESNISRYQKWLRENGRSENTIKSHLAHIMGAMSWAKSQKLVEELPTIRKPKRAKKSTSQMKGRPITDAEFQLMRKAAREVIVKGRVAKKRKPAIVASWDYLLEGLW